MLTAMKLNRLIGLALVTASLLGCREETDVRDYEKEITTWRSGRIQRLTAEGGWLTVVGLHWLKEGPNRIGSGPDNDVVLTANAPAHAGVVTVAGSTATLVPDPSAALTVSGRAVDAPTPLLADADEGGPTTVKHGSVSFFVIKRGDKLALRVKDSASDARRHFTGIDEYPIDANYRVVARFEPYATPKKIPIANIIGTTTDEVAPGRLHFSLEGKEYSVEPILEQGETDLFVIFRDQTSGKTTYPAGRFLYAKPAGPDGTTILDFNKAYNPPCAFTQFATCPLPPRQNWLPVKIEAGEKTYGH